MIKPDDLNTVREKGLPFHKQPYKFGHLFISFKVVFPDSIPLPQIAGIKQLLGASEREDADMETSETCGLIAFEESQRNTRAGGGQQADSDEEEEGHPGGGQRVQCQQQ